MRLTLRSTLTNLFNHFPSLLRTPAASSSDEDNVICKQHTSRCCLLCLISKHPSPGATYSTGLRAEPYYKPITTLNLTVIPVSNRTFVPALAYIAFTILTYFSGMLHSFKTHHRTSPGTTSYGFLRSVNTTCRYLCALWYLLYLDIKSHPWFLLLA